MPATGRDVACNRDRDCGDDAYCAFVGPASLTGSCRPYIPVLVSHYLLELYNGSLRRAYHLPQLDPERVIGATVDLTVGASMLRADPRRGVSRERVRLVGFSDRAIPFGLTLPIDVVRELNVRFGSARAADAYHSAIVELFSPKDAGQVIAAAESLKLVVSDRGARRAAGLLALVMAIVAAVGAAVLGVAATSVAHALFLSVVARRREIAVLRALGATRGDIRGMVVGEAVVIGVAAGAAGVAIAAAGAVVVDRLAARWVSGLPYQPDSLFLVEPWLIVGGLAIAVVAAVLGALPAVRRSAGPDPASTLSGS
jgi:hypothetical protein